MPKNKKNSNIINENLPYTDDEIQRAAITFGNGPLLIVAGAGTGKTGVITKRIAWLISDFGAKPSEILALTFSEAAAREMEERVDKLVPYGMVDPVISTFHSFGRLIINENTAEMGIPPDWEILKESDAVIMVVENLDRFKLDIYKPLNNPAHYLLQLMSFISKLKDNLISPCEYRDFARSFSEEAKSEEDKEIALRHMELSDFYAEYEKLKDEKNRMDFGDLIMKPYMLLKSRRHLLKKYRERFRYILIDEFQDTNYAQFELVKLIAGDNGNINAVGDDDQMIYRFRGAAISNIMEFMDTYKNAQKIVLKNNYRSAQEILDASHKLISGNSDRLETRLGIDKKLISKYKPDHRIERINVRVFGNFSEESDFIADTILNFVKKGMYKFSDFAVLVRTKNDARMTLKTFEKNSIPYNFSGDEGLFNKKEVQLLINFLRVLAAPYEFNAVLDVAISDIYEIDPFVMAKFGQVAREYNLAVIDVLREAKLYSSVNAPEKELLKISGFVKDIDRYLLKTAEKTPPGEILFEYLKEKKIIQELLLAESPETEAKAANIAAFFEILKRFSVNAQYDTVHNFVSYIDLAIKSGENPSDDDIGIKEKDAVNVMSIHKAKGLEFKVVFIIALIQEKFPGRRRGDSSLPLPEKLMHDNVDEETYFIEEERRLFYVAMTRAKDALYLTAARQYEGAAGKKISVFLKETGFEVPEDFAVTPDKNKRFEYFEKKQTVLERTMAEKKEGPLKISNYQIDDYLTCPFKYKLVHIFKMPIREKPNVMIGSAMHAVAAEFYRARQEGRMADREELLKIFDSMWKPAGFITKQEADKNREAAINSINNFYDKESANTNVPKFIEKDFEFKLSSELIVRGRWDRIDEVDGKTIIIDYKISDVRDGEKAEDKLKNPDMQRQLKLYCLAYEKVFGKLPDLAGLYFFKSSMLVTKAFKEKTIREYEEKIFEVAENIRAGRFAATPSVFTCRFCAFYNICPHSKADLLF